MNMIMMKVRINPIASVDTILNEKFNNIWNIVADNIYDKVEDQIYDSLQHQIKEQINLYALYKVHRYNYRRIKNDINK